MKKREFNVSTEEIRICNHDLSLDKLSFNNKNDNFGINISSDEINEYFSRAYKEVKNAELN